jgi:putative membrane protein
MIDETRNAARSLEKPKSATNPPNILADDRVFLAWQRTHMANERTFLAWSRTSIALVAFGFVIEKFDFFIRYLLRGSSDLAQLGSSSQIVYLSLGSFLLAGLAIVISGIRFLKVRRHINLGEPSFSVIPDLLVILSVMVIVVITIVLTVRYISAMG